MKKFIKEVIGYTTAILLTCGIILVSAMAAPDGDTSLAIDENSAIPPAPEWYDYDHENGTFLEPGSVIQIPDGCYAYKVDWEIADEYVITDIDFLGGIDYLLAHKDMIVHAEFQDLTGADDGTITVSRDGSQVAKMYKDGNDIIVEGVGPLSGKITFTKICDESFKLPETAALMYSELHVDKWLYGATHQTLPMDTIQGMAKLTYALVDGDEVRANGHVISIAPMFEGEEFYGDDEPTNEPME
jgi:hypothetical protein